MKNKVKGRGTRSLLVGLTVVLVVGRCALAGSARAKTVFTFGCADEATFQAANLETPAKNALRNLGVHGVRDWADRAVSAAPDTTGTQQWFVPLTCGATCNCTWAVFRGTPPTQVGVVEGCVLQIQSAPPGSATVLAYYHRSAGDGVIATYALRDGAYHEISESALDWATAAERLDCESAETCCK